MKLLEGKRNLIEINCGELARAFEIGFIVSDDVSNGTTQADLVLELGEHNGSKFNLWGATDGRAFRFSPKSAKTEGADGTYKVCHTCIQNFISVLSRLPLSSTISMHLGYEEAVVYCVPDDGSEPWLLDDLDMCPRLETKRDRQGMGFFGELESGRSPYSLWFSDAVALEVDANELQNALCRSVHVESYLAIKLRYSGELNLEVIGWDGEKDVILGNVTAFDINNAQPGEVITEVPCKTLMMALLTMTRRGEQRCVLSFPLDHHGTVQLSVPGEPYIFAVSIVKDDTYKLNPKYEKKESNPKSAMAREFMRMLSELSKKS